MLAAALLASTLAGLATSARAQEVAAAPSSSLRTGAAVLADPLAVARVVEATGFTEERVRSLLADPSARVTARDRIVFVDEGAPVAVELGQQLIERAAALVATQAAAADAAMLLHSKPGAPRVVFLDVDGGSIINTDWNPTPNVTYTVPAWDPGANGAAFSASELVSVTALWQRVAEDYAVFDVDVTTEDPGPAATERSSAGDLNYGAHVMITSDDATMTTMCGGSCGGIANVGVFNLIANGLHSHDYYQPAWVFASSAMTAAEAASHEVGHQVGLDHDGQTPSTAYFWGVSPYTWAPIMGAGYYAAVTQWSKGEYANANNTQDDLAVMQTYGLPLLADDVGDSIGASTTLPSVGSQSVNGRITTAADVDVYRLNVGAGTLSVATTSPSPAPNLDVKLTLSDANGVPLLSANPAHVYGASVTAKMDASFTTTVAAGTYYVSVEGVGAGNPLVDGYSDYASIGRYSLAVSAAVPASPRVAAGSTSSAPGGPGRGAAAAGQPAGGRSAVPAAPRA